MRGALLASMALLLLSGCASSNGTLSLHVTDAPDNLGDFSVLNVTVTKITLTGKDGGEKDYAPASGTFDLTKLASGNVSTIFSGAVDNGNYTKLTLSIQDAKGVLKSNGQSVDVKAPGGKIFLATSFEIASGKETDFLFDVQVHVEGNGGYVFQPNATGSGPNQKGKA
ncbi:MAG: hypothetical protein QOE90_2572 [Thermoplasmata archaeon]|jgi:hypothetical protein|nr:hypothetical protein [Thermoplasmata archaeon]